MPERTRKRRQLRGMSRVGILLMLKRSAGIMLMSLGHMLGLFLLTATALQSLIYSKNLLMRNF